MPPLRISSSVHRDEDAPGKLLSSFWLALGFAAEDPPRGAQAPMLHQGQRYGSCTAKLLLYHVPLDRSARRRLNARL